jgi:hypothetical protein
MNSYLLINYLIQQRHFTRYLEITVHHPSHNFSRVQCAHKSTVLPNHYSDFFSKKNGPFDLVFIDGIHTEVAVLTDITNALANLSAGGIIVLHDCMPPDAWHQREPEDFREGENWNGTVWKAALRVFNRSTYQCTLLDMDWGCGIIDTAHEQIPAERALPDVLDYTQHYPLLLEYRSGVADWLRRQVKVFYHLACMGNWKEVFPEQMRQLQQNGFRNIRMSILGSTADLSTVHTAVRELDMEADIFFHSEDLNCFEKPALEAIENYARHNGGHILYLHSKGVSNPGDQTKTKWRKLMMRELIDNWEGCMLQLPHYDVIGVNWRDMPPTSHFCGNFWYASVNYLRKLADFNSYYNNPRYRIWDRINDKRLGCEFWIGSGKEKPRVLSLFCRNVDFCNHEYWRNK